MAGPLQESIVGPTLKSLMMNPSDCTVAAEVLGASSTGEPRQLAAAIPQPSLLSHSWLRLDERGLREREDR